MAGWQHCLQRSLPLGLMLLVTGSCSSFHREWRDAAALAPATNSLAGRWEGTWLSDANGHRGRLRCLVTPLEGDQYRARYHGTFWKIFRFGYTTEMAVQREPDGWSFAGQADLGMWGGYQYRGEVSGTNFIAHYETKFDRGVFRMQRPH